jgi:hypothetical protein
MVGNMFIQRHDKKQAAGLRDGREARINTFEFRPAIPG